jgi:glycine oxidase
VAIIGIDQPGQASKAAAGMLAPSVEQSSGPAHDFAIAARDFYPDFLEQLADDTGLRVPLNRLGILQVALTERGVRGLQKTAPSTSSWLTRTELGELEPTMGHALGAVFNPDDGAVDNVQLVNALSFQAGQMIGVARIGGKVLKVRPSAGGVSVDLHSGDVVEGEVAVVAAGAWGALIEGVKGLSAVKPCKGQLISYESIGLRHVTYGPRGYLVPRSSGVTIAGSTMEMTGFDSSTTSEGLARVRSAAEEIAPGFAISRVTDEWAGLRPITPDMQPIIGRDEENPSIIYACGHSRNGILLAPLTGETVAALAVDESPQHDLSQFRPGRF